MKRLLVNICLILATLSLSATDYGVAFAQDTRDMRLDVLLEELVESHDRIKASEAQLQSAQHQLESAQGAWYPQLNVIVEGGRENIKKPTTNGTNGATQYTRNSQTLSATQTILDFGSVSGPISSAEGQVKESGAVLSQTRQEVIALGIVAYLRVVRSRELVKYAKRSEESIKELSGMQETLVERGAGYSYEELQVKGQLAGVQSYRVTQERELNTAINNFKSVFGFVPTEENVAAMTSVPVPAKYLPESIDEAIAIAFENNPILLEAAHSLERLKGDLATQESGYYPHVDAILEAERKENDQGVANVRTEERATLQLTYNLFSGFQDTENIRSVKSQMTSTKRMLLDRRRTVEEGVRNAWLELTTLQQNAKLYQTQADITWEFLGLVKRKKATGEDVPLLDILVGERDYINAISAKVAADMDIMIAGYTLLYEMGLITKDITEM